MVIKLRIQNVKIKYDKIISLSALKTITCTLFLIRIHYLRNVGKGQLGLPGHHQVQMTMTIHIWYSRRYVRELAVHPSTFRSVKIVITHTLDLQLCVYWGCHAMKSKNEN